ncbi:hypothetical protein LCGC14_1225480 [marine sediment metagenome]|uniref:Uncharacterized protein n=1 Tax=marine sediment metagenome TaxID=412755 RepID=A0A0F9LE17_9ZZZZ
MVTRNKDYYTEFIKETQKIVREQDQTTEVSDLVREIESHRSGLEEKEMRTNPLGDMVHNALTEAMSDVPIRELEDMEGMSLEDKLIAAGEEEYPQIKELTPGEISRIVNNALRDLPESLVEENGSEISDCMFDVAYNVMRQQSEEE